MTKKRPPLLRHRYNPDDKVFGKLDKALNVAFEKNRSKNCCLPQEEKDYLIIQKATMELMQEEERKK